MPTTNRSKATLKRLDAAIVAFHTRYSSPEQYGQSRWNDDLMAALIQPTSHAALVNCFVSADMVLQLFRTAGIDDHELKELAFSDTFDLELLRIGHSPQGCVPPSLICFGRVAVAKLHEGHVSTHTLKSSGLPFPVPSRLKSLASGNQELLSHWNMDAASILAASLLGAQPGDRVLDLCSAPGGKAIVLSQSLFSQSCASDTSSLSLDIPADVAARTALHCNELDPQRNKRLQANLQAYLPAHLFTQKAVKVLQLDASSKAAVASLPCGPAGYDKVLIDAPCSSERHILHAHTRAMQSGVIAEEMLNWKPNHSLALAKTQVSLLTNGLLATRIGGRVVYATCALGREENDMVIETVLSNIKKEYKREKSSGTGNRWNWRIELIFGEEGTGAETDIPLLNERTEQTRYGRIALPDRGGWGPLYFCVMHKIEKRKKMKQQSGDKREETVAA